ncbi:LacI family DNA-binding transcriptional regulator [Anaerosalibacter bizertensis]|uniref:LacI family transcriptional regulator n=1 Tax=Anaerosalibacter bizertensis TaxID=932217 RepID=A0A9Q4ADN3_9FIRM|nr:LacI family DNA-binding transcriptional regulator [Anaerosalibacter bizertensis]MBV1818224.1 LacI family transcriptional regulator [Bacteroidales bacterium MSK.15.36]MCG4565457.1 LacI family transcriptional regulator [Anaerosalibacter bizertensis]
MADLSIKDIAEIAGVGVSTVSRVLNDHPDVGGKTREKVLEIIEEYNYIPNNSARNLKRSSTNNIGVLVKGIHNPFFSQMIKAVEEEINKKDYSMILHYNEKNSNDIEVAIELIKEKRLKGLICLGGDFDDLENNQLLNLKTPIVLTSINITEEVNKDVFSSVIIENEIAAFEAVDYLCKLGHEKIGLISTGEGDKNVGRLRQEGYKKALKANGIEYNEELISFAHYTFKSGYESMSRLLDKGLGITAVFVTSDIMAIGASKAILSRGLRIPEDISIVGFDGIEYSEYFHPSITTVKQPIEEMGRKSAEILFHLIEDKKEQQHIVFKTELLKRESCKKLK